MTFLMISITGCSSKIRKLEVYPTGISMPKEYKYSSIKPTMDCKWNGDKTYRGQILHLKKLQKCVKIYETKLKDIEEWDNRQRKIIQESVSKYSLQ